jgi:predicted DNA-binding transcriptional regulator AlpA
MAKEFCQKAAVAEFFDISKSTVDRWVDRGVLPPPVKMAGVKLWRVSDLRNAAARALNDRAGIRSAESDPDLIFGGR